MNKIKIMNKITAKKLILCAFSAMFSAAVFAESRSRPAPSFIQIEKAAVFLEAGQVKYTAELLGGFALPNLPCLRLILEQMEWLAGVGDLPDKFDSSCLSAAQKETLTLVASHLGIAKAVAHFIEEGGVSPDIKDDYGITALLHAVWNGRPGAADTVKFLMSKDADPYIEGIYGGWTPLTMAVATGQANTVKILLENGVDPDRPTGFFEETALCGAVRSGQAHIVKILMEHGADPNDLCS